MKFPGARIVQFAKAPRQGRVKTRLIPALGASGALALHQRLLKHTHQSMRAAAVSPVELWVSDSPDHPFFTALPGVSGNVFVQQGQDLGQRMAHAIEQVLERSDYVVLIGSDCAVLDGHYMTQAMQHLHDGAPVVLGPASDGGYVLIGMRRLVAEVFKDIKWGTDQVLEQTRQRLRAAGCDWHELPELWDVDRPEDVFRLDRLKLI